jgi:hypothetical protein
MKLNLIYIGNNGTDTSHVVYRDNPAEKEVSLFHTISIGTARNKGTAGK